MSPLLAQAVVEHGLLDSLSSRASAARYEIDARLGQGSSKWLLIGLAVLFVYWAFRRR